MGKDVIVACDFDSKKETLDFLSIFEGKRLPFVKIGMELFYSEGPDIVREIKKRGHRIFLDLKLHDIPNTVKKSMHVLSELDVDITNLHIAGGSEMMRSAITGLTKSDGTRPLLIGVTMLTSTDQKMMEEELLIKGKLKDTVRSYAKNAKECGLDGVVCSPQEADDVHEWCGRDFITVTPGIRFPEDSGNDDQKRVMSPAMAREQGSDYIVVGRPITKADDPLEAYVRCVREFLN